MNITSNVYKQMYFCIFRRICVGIISSVESHGKQVFQENILKMLF